MRQIFKNLATAICFVIAVPSIGQLSGSVTQLDSIVSLNDQKIIAISTEFNARSRDIYIDSEWKYGVILSEKNEIIHFNGRINIMRGYLECKVNNRIRKVASGRIKLIKLDGKTFIPVKGTAIEKGGINTYMEILSYGDYTLLRNYYVEMETRQGDNLNPGLTGSQSAVMRTRLFYTTDFAEISSLKTTKNGVLDVLSAKEDQIKQMIEINKLKFNSERDIAIMFNYFNSSYN